MNKYPKTPEEHMQWATEQGLCYQCMNPLCKGICSCGGWKKHEKYMKKILKVFVGAENKAFHEYSERRKKGRNETN